MIYELRQYSALPGQMPRLLARFQNHTLGLWKTHGIRQVGFWTVVIGDGNNDLYYLLAWDSLADREKRWNGFIADAGWQAARIDSEKDGPILANIKSTMLAPTAFSELK